jgi:hypothetical protein
VTAYQHLPSLISSSNLSSPRIALHCITANRLAFEIETSKRYLKSNQELEAEFSGVCRERDDIRAMFEEVSSEFEGNIGTPPPDVALHLCLCRVDVNNILLLLYAYCDVLLLSLYEESSIFEEMGPRAVFIALMLPFSVDIITLSPLLLNPSFHHFLVV